MVAGCRTQNIGGNWICWRNMLFLQVYERLWILFPVIKRAGERKKNNLPCSSVGWSSFYIPLNTNYSLPIHLWVILLSCIRISILFFNLNAHGYILQREERNRSLSISPCISLKKKKGSTWWQLAVRSWIAVLCLRAGQLRLPVLTNSCVVPLTVI